MKKLIAIVAGEPNSINSEIIAKSWKVNKKNKNLFVIGNYYLFKKQINDIGINIPVTSIDKIQDIKKNMGLCVLNVPLNFKSVYDSNIVDTKKYVIKCLDIAHYLANTKKIIGFVNAPVDKKIFNKKYLGVTEYLAHKNNVKNKEVMMIHNKKLSVVPLTTHLEIKNVTNKISFDLIKVKTLTINKYYKKLFGKEPRIIVLGLNPHNSEDKINSIESKIIAPSIINLQKIGINIRGPYPADTAFSNQKKLKYDLIIGMYHDQVLAPFKALFGYDAINITLGLKYLRISPDHGTAKDIIGLNKANPESLLSAINFLNKIND